MAVTFQRVGIIGSGAIGSYYGGRLALAGAEVRFLMRGDLAAVRARGSIRITDLKGTFEARPIVACASSREIGPVDLVVVALKTTSASVTRDLVSPLLGPDTAILTLQNGLGADEFLAGLFGPERVMGGLVFMAITRTGPGEVRCFSPGLASVGEFAGKAIERTRALAAQLDAAGINSLVVDDLLEARWRKLVWNIPFNGLAIARGSVTTDQICRNPQWAEEAKALMREVQAAAAAQGFAIPDSYLERQFAVTPPMGAYAPSSLVDFRAGREVEVESIWGEPLRRALAHGVGMPRLQALYDTLCSLCPKSRE